MSEKRLPFVSGNSELVAVRVPKQVLRALETDAKLRGLAVQDHIRDVLYFGSFSAIADEFIATVKRRLREDPESDRKKLVDVFDSIEMYFQQAEKFCHAVEKIKSQIPAQRAHFKKEREEIMRKLESALDRVRKSVSREKEIRL